MISRSQLLFLLLLSRLSAEILFPQQMEYSLMSLAAVAAAEGIRFILALPVLLYSVGGWGFYPAVCRKSKPLGIASAFLGAVLMGAAAVRTLLYNAQYASILVDVSSVALLVLLVLFAAYVTYRGLEAAARSSVLFLIAAAAVTLTAVLSSAGEMSLEAFSPLSTQESFVGTLLRRLMSGGEYLVFAALLPYVSQKGSSLGCGGTGFIFAAASLAAVLGLSLASMAVLGELTPLERYPFTSAAQLSDILLFKRLDGLSSAVWSLCGALRAGVFIIAAKAAVQQVVGKKKAAA